MGVLNWTDVWHAWDDAVSEPPDNSLAEARRLARGLLGRDGEPAWNSAQRDAFEHWCMDQGILDPRKASSWR